MSSPIITHTWPQNGETDNVFLEKTEVQPRMDLDGHGYQTVAESRQFTWLVKEIQVSKSVFIRG
jgi:hypothetical protein